MRKLIVALIGDASIEKNSIKYKLAFETGKLLIDNGFRVKSGGMEGVMAAFFEGARSSKNYKEGDTIAIIPGFNSDDSNSFADIIIPTGIDLMRNVIVANSDAVIALGGRAGTLSEIASAWSLKKLIFAYDNVDGWSKKLAGTKIDSRNRFGNLEDKIWPVSSPLELVKQLKEKIKIYKEEYIPITELEKKCK